MKILFRLILVLSVATRQAQRNRLREWFSLTLSLAYLALEKVKEKLLNDEDTQCVLRRLSRLTQEEIQMTMIQNMEVVYCLISNIRVIMDGAQSSAGYPTCSELSIRLFRCTEFYRWDPTCSRYVGLFLFNFFLL
jgi:hypothetical protein